MPESTPSYRDVDCASTLRDCIAHLRLEDAKARDVAPAFAPETQRSLTAHDSVHVIFACDTSDRGEAIAHAWMLLGTDVTHRQLLNVTGARDHTRIVREIGVPRRLSALLSALPAIFDAALRARRMTHRWSWNGYEAWLDKPLTEIRAAHGVILPVRRR